MAPRPRNVTYVSVQLTQEEKDILDAEVKRVGLTRNRFIRNWIASLARK